MPRTTQSKRTYRYSDEFKVQSGELSLAEDLQIKQIADSLGIHLIMLSRRREECREGTFKSGKQQLKRAVGEAHNPGQIASLERKVARLQRENEILKKWQRFLRNKRPTVQVRERAMQPLSSKSPLRAFKDLERRVLRLALPQVFSSTR
ncbi:MAG: transposase [Cycloclasticus sp.]|nr:transposase [Cycloclasticus sp.]